MTRVTHEQCVDALKKLGELITLNTANGRPFSVFYYECSAAAHQGSLSHNQYVEICRQYARKDQKTQKRRKPIVVAGKRRPITMPTFKCLDD